MKLYYAALIYLPVTLLFIFFVYSLRLTRFISIKLNAHEQIYDLWIFKKVKVQVYD